MLNLRWRILRGAAASAIFYENGTAKYLQTAPEVVEAVETLQGAPQSTWIVKILTAATGALLGLYKSLTTLLATWKGLMFAIHKDKIFYEWLAMCGAQSTLVSPDRDYTQSSVDKITKTQKERWLKSGVKEIFGQVLNALQTVSEYSEYATRIGTYKVSKDALAAKNNGNATLDDMKAAAMNEPRRYD